MSKINSLITLYGNLMFDCGAFDSDADSDGYDKCVSKTNDAHMALLGEHIDQQAQIAQLQEQVKTYQIQQILDTQELKSAKADGIHDLRMAIFMDDEKITDSKWLFFYEWLKDYRNTLRNKEG